MHRLHAAVLRPLIAVLEPRVVVEVGAGQGRLTARLLGDDPQPVVHAVDPEPEFDAALLAREHESRLTLHRTTSEEALPAIGPCDLAILDGDPNHRAVLTDLTTLARLEQPPVVVVHHTGWPFGRRDGFHRRSTNPDAVEAGVLPGHRTTTTDPAGLRLVPFVAATDVGGENGVQRAVDRHLADHAEWSAVGVPGLHGCTVLCPPRRLAEHQELSSVLRAFTGAPFLADQVRRVERAHLAAAPAAVAAETEPEEAKAPAGGTEQEPVPPAEHERLVAEAARARGELEATVREVERAHAAAAEAIERAASAQAAHDQLGEVVTEQRRRLEGLRVELGEQVARAEALEAAAEVTRTELRTSREDAARRASEVDHLAAQLSDAAAALEAFAAERLLTRRRRFARAIGRLRGRRGRESAQLNAALEALVSPGPKATRPVDSDRERAG